jgi:hypothetical protein
MDPSSILKYSKLATMLLNDIETNVETLSNPTCKKLLGNGKSFCGDIRSVILYGNEMMFLKVIAERLVKSIFDIQTLQKRTNTFPHTTAAGTTSDIEYIHSDYHFELMYSEKHIKFMKSLLSNRAFENRKFVFIITGLEHSDISIQLPLKQMIDMENNSCFIFVCSTLGKMHQTLMSRSAIINTSFPIKQIHNYVLTKVPTINIELKDFTDLYYKSQQSVIAVLIKLEFGDKPIKFFEHIDVLLNTIKKEKNQLTAIIAIREFVYKAYHLTVPFTTIAYHVIRFYSKSKGDMIHNIVRIAAECDAAIAVSSKDILIYEKFFLELRQLHHAK